MFCALLSIVGIATGWGELPQRLQAPCVQAEHVAARGLAQGDDDRRHPRRKVWVPPVVHPGTALARCYEFSGAHHREVARDNRLRQTQGRGKITHAKLPEGLEEHEEAPPGGVAQYRKKVVIGRHAPIIFQIRYICASIYIDRGTRHAG